jgi:Bifunctional DNA primase/polymerase, N-terminal/AAA domain
MTTSLTATEQKIINLDLSHLNAAMETPVTQAHDPSPFDLAAPRLIERGIPVIPLQPRTKVTHLSNWQELATTDLKQVKTWAEENPEANVACVAKAKPGGVWFFEIDKPGLQQEIERETGNKFPETMRVCSSPERDHLYFRQTPASMAMGNAQGKDDEGKEAWSARVDNRYVVGPQSYHPTSGKQYEVISDAPIIDAPDWLIEWCLKHNATGEAQRERVNASQDGPPIPRGSHDTELFRIACLLRNAGMDYEQIRDNLVTVCEKRCTGYGSDYVDMCEKKAKSACNYPVGKATHAYVGSSQSAPAATAKVENLAERLASSIYNYKNSAPARVWDYANLIPRGAFCLWVGARKAEKSLFAFRKAMHDACGKDWLNHKNLRGPLRVLYFDTENDKADVDERYREIITEFTSDEQALIQTNLIVFVGKEMKKKKIDIEVWNNQLFEHLRNSGNPDVVYLDCWYQLQSVKAIDNEKQKQVLEMFELYFPNSTIFLLHHTGREAQESLVRRNPTWLRVIGAERWSNKSAGGNVLTKKAEVIICQEKYVERDEEGIENDWMIDLQAYSRSTPGSILYSFEPVFFGDEVNGDAPEYKFRRKMVVKLSSLAAQAARKLQGKGPWTSRYALARDVGMNGGKQYKAIDELIVKGFLTDDGRDAGFSFTDDEDVIELSAENVVAMKTAGSFLDELLLRPDGTPNQGVLYDFIKARAEGDGISLASLRKARQRKKVKSEEREGKTWWVANAVTKWPQLIRAA